MIDDDAVAVRVAIANVHMVDAVDFLERVMAKLHGCQALLQVSHSAS